MRKPLKIAAITTAAVCSAGGLFLLVRRFVQHVKEIDTYGARESRGETFPY